MADFESLGTTTNLVALAMGSLAGLAIGYWLSPALRTAKRLRLELDRTLEEHERYRSSVTAHFRKTADLVGNLTRSYAAVYDHLATGARNFCDETGSDREVTLDPLPARLEQGAAATATGSAAVTVTAATTTTATVEAGADSTVQAPDSTASLDTPAGTTSSATG